MTTITLNKPKITPKLLKKIKIERYPYSILKIIPYKNSYSHKDFEKIINAISKYNKSFIDRISIDKKKKILIYHPNQPIAYEILYTKNKINYFYAIPSIYEKIFINKLKFLLSNCEIVKAKNYLLDFNNSYKQSYRYKKNWMFSLNTDNNINLNNNLIILHKDLQNTNDKVLLQFLFKPLFDNQWKNIWEKNYNKYSNTGIIQSNYNLLDIAENIIDFLLFQLDLILNSIICTIGGEEPLNTNKEKINYSKELDKTTKQKISYDGFKTNINLYLKVKNNITLDNICRSTNAIFKDTDGDNALISTKGKFVKTAQRRISKRSYIMNTKEVVQFIKTPSKERMIEFEDIIEKIDIEETKIPKNLYNNKGLFMGEIIKGNKYEKIYSGNHLNSISKPYFYISPQEGGKSSMLRSYAIDALLQGHSIFAFDTIDGKNITHIRDYLPKDFPDEKIIILDFKNDEYAFSLMWNEIIDIYSKKIKNAKDNIDRYRTIEKCGAMLSQEFEWFIDMFQYEDRNNRLSTTMKSQLSKLAQLVLMNNGSFNMIKDCLYDKKLRNKLLKQLDIPKHLTFAQEILKFDSEDNSMTLKGIESRLNVMLGNPTLKKYFSLDSSKKLDFAKWANNGYCVLIRTSQETADVLVPFLVQKLWLAILASREHMNEDDRPMTHLLIDEPNRFPSVMALLEDHVIASRKWHLRFLFFVHNVDIFRRMKNNLLNAGFTCLIVPPTSPMNFNTVNNVFTPYKYEDLREIEKLIAKNNGKYRFALTSIHYKNVNHPVVLKLPLPVEKRLTKINRSYLDRKCAKKYGVSQREYYEKLFNNNTNKQNNEDIDTEKVLI
ncbi:MAG TPA: hypothetical protein VK982_11750 [Bacteroidales bacterium]|nr:hypothetical protein [Bacteroidales bacterium]